MTVAGGQGQADTATPGRGLADTATAGREPANTATGTLVVAIGQLLAGDDAVGLVVAERLRTLGIQVRTVPDGAALADLLSTTRRAVLIDAVVGAGPAGTVVCLDGDDLVQLASGPGKREDIQSRKGGMPPPGVLGPPGLRAPPPPNRSHPLAQGAAPLGGAAPVSSHGISVALAVSIARALGGAETVHLVGIAIDAPCPLPESLSGIAAVLPRTGAATPLSPDVAAAVDRAVLRVREVLEGGSP